MGVNGELMGGMGGMGGMGEDDRGLFLRFFTLHSSFFIKSIPSSHL